ncbi:HD-like signal output (HDOD) domain, no enzymatic activity [Halopseudomonas xinjiangensis]|uniref:HD-like signal output (HDOD) domain, no enzymatic activity n=1 Tax=Halopseudomonas xinjiangensis TaxID=487184 RepID=A0A1H1XH17_9GAMM|nr:HDOD domain-containing protein [Halopseudomonas xinjiangensis]SDT08554.1 HD-like signal output (HDOD) domain, no enzymatic activity [Halopseudomonas xinjiangensis]
MNTLAVTDAGHTSLPDSIEKLLQQQGIGYHLRQADQLGPLAQQVQACLLGDSVGMLLALFPRDRLIDLKRIGELLGRELEPVRMAQAERILAKHGISTVPGLPMIFGSPCVFEQQLVEHNRLWIDSGLPGLYLEIESDDIGSLISKASSGRFSVPLSSLEPLPSDPEQDRNNISDAVKNFTALRMRQRLEETIEIPPLPETAQKVMKLRVDPDATIEQLADVVETDPSLAAQVVSWASSPYYAAPGKIRSVEDAIGRVLGFDLVINLAVGLALGKTFSLPKDTAEGSTQYWEQAIYSAAIIEGLAKAMPRNKRPELGLNYLAGLLHNFGYLVLAYIFPPYFKLICRHVEANPHVPSHLIEQHLLGVTRDQIGSWLMRYWDMPAEVSTAIRYQHDANYDGDLHVYANLVYLTLALLRERDIGSGPQMPIPDALLERLNLSRDDAAKAADKVLDARDALRVLVHEFKHGWK